MNKTARIISNKGYDIGVVMAVSFGCIAIFGSAQLINPDAMISFIWKEQAFMWLAFGAVHMLYSRVWQFRGL